MWFADRYVRCQVYASGPMSVSRASYDNCPQKIEKCHVLMARSMYACVLFEKPERSEDTGLISGVDLIKSLIVVKAFE